MLDGEESCPATHQTVAQATKTKNIIEMALGFSVMTRVFAEGSKTEIFRGLEGFFAQTNLTTSKEEYESAHTDFCTWFTRCIRTAEKKLKNGRIKVSCPCSFGQAAKVLDIAAKVYFYYCAQPNLAVSRRLIPMLHGQIPLRQRGELVLALDATRLPVCVLDSVTSCVRERHGAVLESTGFRSVWVVGPTDSLTKRLDFPQQDEADWTRSA